MKKSLSLLILLSLLVKLNAQALDSLVISGKEYSLNHLFTSEEKVPKPNKMAIYFSHLNQDQSCFEVDSKKMKVEKELKIQNKDPFINEYQRIISKIILGAHQSYDLAIQDQKIKSLQKAKEDSKNLKLFKKQLPSNINLSWNQLRLKGEEKKSLETISRLIKEMKKSDKISVVQQLKEDSAQIFNQVSAETIEKNRLFSQLKELFKRPLVEANIPQTSLENSYCEKIVQANKNPEFSFYYEYCFFHPTDSFYETSEYHPKKEIIDHFRKYFCNNEYNPYDDEDDESETGFESERAIDIQKKEQFKCQIAIENIIQNNQKRQAQNYCDRIDEVKRDSEIRLACKDLKKNLTQVQYDTEALKRVLLFEESERSRKKGKTIPVESKLRKMKLYNFLSQTVVKKANRYPHHLSNKTHTQSRLGSLSRSDKNEKHQAKIAQIEENHPNWKKQPLLASARLTHPFIVAPHFLREKIFLGLEKGLDKIVVNPLDHLEEKLKNRSEEEKTQVAKEYGFNDSGDNSHSFDRSLADIRNHVADNKGKKSAVKYRLLKDSYPQSEEFKNLYREVEASRLVDNETSAE